MKKKMTNENQSNEQKKFVQFLFCIDVKMEFMSSSVFWLISLKLKNHEMYTLLFRLEKYSVIVSQQYIYSLETFQRALYNDCADCVSLLSLTATRPNSHKYRLSQLFAPEWLPTLRNFLLFSRNDKYFCLSGVSRWMRLRLA